MSIEALTAAKQAWEQMTPAEKAEFGAWVGERGANKSSAQYDPESIAAGRKEALDAWDEYEYPAQMAAIDLTFLMGLMCGIPLAGFDALPRAQAKIMARYISAGISDV